MINWPLLIQSMPALLQGCLVNLQITFGACLIGFCGGVPLAFWERSGNRMLRSFAICYSTLFRGTPMVVQIMFAYYVLPQLGLSLPPLLAVIVAIGMNSAAYLSQILRAGLESIPKTQLQAAQALGMNSFQAYRYILFPQALRNVLPALGNEGITLLKDSSLASIVGVMEIVKVGSIIRGRTFEALTVLVGVAIVYLVLVSLLTWLTKICESWSKKSCSV